MATAVRKFQSEEEVDAFLDAAPEANAPIIEVPESTRPELLPMPDPLTANDQRLPGVVEPEVAALLDSQAKEPPLPAPDPAMAGLDENLPPVVSKPAPFSTEEEIDAFLDAPAPKATAAPSPSPIPEATPSVAFANEAEADAFLDAGVVKTDPEAKPPIKLAFGGQEAALAKAVMGDKKETPPPVTTPEAADGTDVTFEEGDAPFKFTGKLVIAPGTGPTAGLDGMQPVTPAGPVAPDQMAGPQEAAMNRQPRLVPDGGQIVFDTSSPERFTEGVEQAFESGLLPRANYEKLKANQADVFKVVEDRRKLEAKAQQDPRLLAALQGLGKGGAITAGAYVGAQGLGLLGALTGPAAPIAGPALALVGGIGGGISAGIGYDALYKQLGKHFEQYDNVMRAAELYPQYKANGELAMAALALPVSATQAYRGLAITAQQAQRLGTAVAPAVARQAGKAILAGAGTGVVAYPIDAAVRGEEITPGGFAAAAGTGALMGGFFINNKMATEKDVFAVAAKMTAGVKLTAAEEALARAAEPAMRAAFAEMEAAGGMRVKPHYDAQGKFQSGDPEVRVPMTSVAGFSPAAGKATAKVPYTVPLRLGAPAAAKAEAARAELLAGATAGAADSAATGATARPTVAPVNVLPTGPDVIPMPGPAPAAAMGVRAFLYSEVPKRGIDPNDTPAVMALMNEHKAAVAAAIDAEQPVAADALDAYEFDVPYYVRNEETGMATFDAGTFQAWSEYMGGRDAEMRDDNEENGVELLDAIAELGGLPSQKAGDRRGAWAGELASLLETAQGAGRGKGSDNQKGVFLNKLFRRDAKDIDDLVTGLRQKGFRVETPQELIDLLDNRLRSGRPVYGYGAFSDDPLPAELRGRRAAPGSPRQMDLLGEKDVEFTLQGQADRTSLTPEEMIQRNLEAQRAQDAEKLQGDLFGEKRGKAPQRSIEEEIPLGLYRPAKTDSALEALDEDTFYAERDKRTKELRELNDWLDNQENSEQLMADRGFRTQYAATQDRHKAAELEHYRRVRTEVASSELFTELFDLSAGVEKPGWAASTEGQKFKIITKIIGSREAETRTDAALLESLMSLPERIKGNPNWQEVTDWKMRRTKQALQKVLDEQSGGNTAPTISSDPLTPPLELRSGGGAKVPPGAVPVGMAAMGPPDWVSQPAETGEGRRLVRGIEKFKLGQKWAYGDIITMVRRAIGVESRRSRSQTTATHPAHYRPQDMIEFTRDTFGQIGFHEAGHQLQYMLQARVPGIWQAHERELLGLAQRPGSMASDPPAGATPRQKHLYRVGEGVAEWLRLLVTDPGAVERMPVSQTIVAAADKFYPKISKQVRDAARAMNAFHSRPAVERAAMLNNVPKEQVTLGNMWSAIVRGKEAVGNVVASGAPFDRLPRKVFRMILKARQETGMTYRQAVRAARAAEKQLNQIPGAYNYVLGIGEEAQLAISAKGPSKGLRMQKPDGSIEYLTRWTWDDLRARVPAQHMELFDIGAWALESSERWIHEKMEYTGMRDGITPDDLLAIVKQAKDAIPAFGQLFAEQSNFLHTVEEMKEYGQILSREERVRFQYKRDTYWPLPEAFVGSAGGGGRSGARINKGVFRAFGHSGPTAKIDAVVVDKVTDALTSVAWNNLLLVAEQRANAFAKDTTLPFEARQLLARLFTEMEMPMSKVAELNETEKANIKAELIESIAKAQEKVLGFKPDIDPDTVHVAWKFKDIWRPIEPGDIQIAARFKDGKRSFVQVGDPSIYAVLAAGKNVNGVVKLLQWAFGPASRNMQKIITENPVFSVPGNVSRDIIQQLVTNTDTGAWDWVPGGSHVAGIINKFTKKYPQVFREGLLLNRDEPTRESLLKRHEHASLWQFLTDGFYVSNAKNPTVRLLATVFNPSNMLFYVPVWPVAKIANAVAPGAMVGLALGGSVGGPVGAAIGAAIGSVAGPLSGFTGKGMATFTEEVGREGNAVRVLQRGGTDAEAMQAYWFRTGQFNEHPGVADIAALLRVAPFANPALQSTRNLVQVLTHPDPMKRFTAYARLAQIAGLAVGAALVRYMMMDKNDRQKERERTMQDRMAYMDMGGIRVPFAYGVQGGVQALVFNAVMDDLLERETDWQKGATMLAKRVFDPQGMFNIMGPQVSSVMEIQRNWSDWRQENIVAPWMMGLPASEQYYSTTPAFYRKLGQMTDWSPIKIQYFVQQGIARQIDDTIRLAESVGGGKPMQEAADLPFVGRMFIRDPIGFASASVQKVSEIESKLQALNTRLNAKGWGFLNSFDKYGNPTEDASNLSPDLQKLQMQLGYLHQLRQSINRLDTVRVIGETMRRAGNYVGERNCRVWQTHIAQATLAGNADRLKVMDAAIEAAQRIAPGSPEQQAADYLRRAR